MDCRVLQLVIQSAQGLRNVNRITTMNPYALVSIRDNHDNLYSSEEKTPEDKGGGPNPTWNSPVTFNNLNITKAKESSLELVVKLISCRTSHGFRDKEIGKVRVLITKLLEGFGGEAKADAVVAEKQMSASVVTTDGKPQGTLVFSYRFESMTAAQKPARQINFPTAPQNVQQNTEQPAAGLTDQLISGTAGGTGGTALNTTGLTSVFAPDAAAPPPSLSSGAAEGFFGTALNTTSDAAAPPSAINTHVAAAVEDDEDYVDEEEEEEDDT